jgi:hypothetical protein
MRKRIRLRLPVCDALLLMLLAAVALGQDHPSAPIASQGKVTGTVVDLVAAVIPRATIIFTGAGAPEVRLTTGSLGNFEASLNPGTYEVRVQVPAFRPERRMVEVKAQGLTHLTFTLEFARSDTAQAHPEVDEVEIPDSAFRLSIEYVPGGKRAQSEDETIYRNESYSPATGAFRAVVIRYRDVTIWADGLELFGSPKMAKASGYVLLDDGTNLPKRVAYAVLRFDKGALRLEAPKWQDNSPP